MQFVIMIDKHNTNEEEEQLLFFPPLNKLGFH